jgi:hypothetical protein
MPPKARFVSLNRHLPTGRIDADDFTIQTKDVPDLLDGQLLLRPIAFSIDPAIRGQLTGVEGSYFLPQLKVGDPLTGVAVAEVVTSRDDNHQPGDLVLGMAEWADYSIWPAPGNWMSLQAVDPGIGKPSYALGVFGMGGLTAYCGIVEAGQVTAGETVVVSAAVGNVGSLALREVLATNTTASTGTSTRLKRLVDKTVEHRHGDGVAPIPSQRTFDRLRQRMAEARHATGSARARRSLANQPEAPFSTVVATRAREWMQIDSTPFDVAVRLDERVSSRGRADRVDRCLHPQHLRGGASPHQGGGCGAVIGQGDDPEPMRPGWPEAIAMAYSALPFQLMRSVDKRLETAAARPVIIPESIVCDNHTVYLSATFPSACRTLGISVQRAHPIAIRRRCWCI